LVESQLPTPRLQVTRTKDQFASPASHVNGAKLEAIEFSPRWLIPPKHEGLREQREYARSAAEAAELAGAIRQIFFSADRTVRSLLFCSVPGDRTTDVAWRAAELLASQSGKPIAFVEKLSNRIAPHTSHGLITQIEWLDEDEGADSAAGRTTGTVGNEIPDLLPQFAFVLVNANASNSDQLAALARQVDGVIVVVLENSTSVEAAQSLVASLRDASATVVGTIFVAARTDHAGPSIFDLKS
jgi:hypothetical protein